MSDATRTSTEHSMIEARPNDALTRALLVGGVIGPALFVVVLLIEGATRPSYSAWHNYGSSLSTGPGGWMQIVNFIVCGVLSVGFAIGLRRVLRRGKGSVGGPILVGIFGLALISAGIFVTDASLGYPPGTHTSGPQSVHGAIHGVSGLVVFAALAVACFVLARRFAGRRDWRGWALYSIVTGIVVALSFISSTATGALDEAGVMPNSPTGLLQRIGIVAGWGWLSLLAFRLLRTAQR